MQNAEIPVEGAGNSAVTVGRLADGDSATSWTHDFRAPGGATWSGVHTTPSVWGAACSARWLAEPEMLLLAAPGGVTALTADGQAWSTPIRPSDEPTLEGVDGKGLVIVRTDDGSDRPSTLRLDPATGTPRLVVEDVSTVSDPVVTLSGYQWGLTLWGWWSIRLGDAEYRYAKGDESEGPVVGEGELDALLGEEFLGMEHPENGDGPTTFLFTTARIEVLVDDPAWDPYVLRTPEGTWTGPSRPD